MATWDDVRTLALALPNTSESTSKEGLRSWRVGDKAFVHERPLRQSDLVALGDTAPQGPILGAWTADLGEKAALLAQRPDLYFTTPHFDGYRMLLIQLEIATVDELGETLEDAWLCRAPKRLVQNYLRKQGQDGTA